MPALMGLDSICLNSVPDAYGFYVRHGFRRWRWDGCTSNRTEIPVMKLLPGIGTTHRAGRLRYPPPFLDRVGSSVGSDQLSLVIGRSQPAGGPSG